MVSIEGIGNRKGIWSVKSLLVVACAYVFITVREIMRPDNDERKGPWGGSEQTGLGAKEEIVYGREHVLWRSLPVITASRLTGSVLYVGGCGCGVEASKYVRSMMSWLGTRRKNQNHSKQAEQILPKPVSRVCRI